jgi:hypothetical protein
MRELLLITDMLKTTVDFNLRMEDSMKNKKDLRLPTTCGLIQDHEILKLPNTDTRTLRMEVAH